MPLGRCGCFRGVRQPAHNDINLAILEALQQRGVGLRRASRCFITLATPSRGQFEARSPAIALNLVTRNQASILKPLSKARCS